MIGELHFLRPWWLLLAPLAAALVVLWRRDRDERKRWQDLIAPHLLDALLIGASGRSRIRPIHTAAALLALAGVAAAGPTWRREPPPFAREQSAIVVAIDLSPSMDATDVAPTRLERAVQKVHDLARERAGARLGLIAYAGTAHLVLPPTDDPDLLALYLDALSTDLMPVPGRAADAALGVADDLLADEPVPGTVLLISDGTDPGVIDAFAKRARASRNQVLVLAVGTKAGGPLRDAKGGVRSDASGRPLTGAFDADGLERLADRAGAPIASLVVDDADVRWIERRAQSHLQLELDRKGEGRWRESGYWLCLPLAALALCSFRRGWVVHWAPALLLVTGIAGASPARAQDGAPTSHWLADLFLTPDQQGRWSFEKGDYATAAQRFVDPLWRGLAAYRAGDFAGAQTAFASVPTAQGFFWLGNARAQAGDYAGSAAAYTLALQRQPAFPQAEANRKLVQALIPEPEDEQAGEPTEPPDEVQFDDKGKKGKAGRMQGEKLAGAEADAWLRRLKPSPAQFLAYKFRAQAAASKDAAP